MTDSLIDIPIHRLDGTASSLGDLGADTMLVVNVASKCGLTPQYEGLEELQRDYGDRGFSVAGIPCNQFMGQEPGTSEEIATFCSTKYGVSFPLFEKVEVNGEDRHPIYAHLSAASDARGHTGDIRWNFEKFLVARDGTILERFAPTTEPMSAEIVTAIEARLG